MKRIKMILLLTILVAGCSQSQGETEKKEPSPEQKEGSTFTPPLQDIEANHTHLDAKIIELQEEDGKYAIRYKAWLFGDKIEGKGSVSEELFKAVKKYHSSNAEEGTYDIIIDGDDTDILGIAPSTERHPQPSKP